MEDIRGTDLVLSVVGRWHPGDLAYIESLQYTAEGDQRAAELVLIGILQRRDSVQGGWPSEREAQYKVSLRFIGVQQLHLKEFGGPPTQIAGFDIIDVSDRGLENIQFFVEDYEHDRIRLSCKQVEIISVNPIQIAANP